MKKINHILYTTDFSQASEAAFSFALEIANRFQCRLSMLHVYEVPNVAPTSAFTTLEDTITHVSEEMEADSNGKLKLLQQQANAYGISCQVFTVQGNVNEEIIKMLGNHTDLVIMGTNGNQADRGLFVGSTANAIIKLANCPVFCVPAQVSLKRIDRIVYATDLRYEETEIINFVITFGRAFAAEVVILHIDQNAENAEWSIDILQDVIANTEYEKAFFREIITNDVFSGIDSYIQDNAVDIVSATTYHTSFFDRLFRKSHTKEILMHSEIPLLAFN